MPWDPNQYLKFAGERVQPALDLIARIGAETPREIVDLGCGAGNLTPFLSGRWPDAHVTGVDNSPDMLARARIDHPAVTFVEADIAQWHPPRPVDALFSNAALHWLDHHPALFPALLSKLSPGGWFAVQMPRASDSPMQACTAEIIASGPWRPILEPGRRTRAVGPPEEYWRLLSPHCASLTLWETEYMHVLSGENPVTEFAKGSGLKQLLDKLQEPMRTDFEAAYRKRIVDHYPREADGHTLFKMRRLFILAQARS